MKIIHRYVLREHVGPLAFSLTALTSLLLLNYIAKQIGNLVGKGLSLAVIGKFFLLSVPFTVAMTMPMSVLVATLYAFSRLAAENEITALKANGVSLSRLLLPVLIAAVAISMGMVAFNDVVLPTANHELRKLQADIARKKPTFGLREQIINEVGDRKVYLKAMKLSTDNRMTDVTIYDLSDVSQRRTIFADSGELYFAANERDLLLTLYDGSTLVVPKEEPERLERLTFARNYVRVEGVANQLETTRSDSYKSDREMSICELQNEVARYEREYAKARTDLEAALRSVTREALTGLPASPPEISPMTLLNVTPGSPTPRSPNPSLGRAYCDVMLRLGRITARSTAFVAPLYAAEARGQGGVPGSGVGAAAAAPRPDTSTREIVPQQAPTPGADSAIRAVTPPSAGLVYRQAPVQVAGTLENARVRMRDNLRFVNQDAVELHKKFAISIACTVFVLVGAPIALRFPRGGVGLVIGVSLAIFGIYYVGLIAGEALADRNVLTPFWAMWAANLLLTAVGVVLLARMGRETATTRGGDFREMLEIVSGMFRRREAPGGRPGRARPAAGDVVPLPHRTDLPEAR